MTRESYRTGRVRESTWVLVIAIVIGLIMIAVALIPRVLPAQTARDTAHKSLQDVQCKGAMTTENNRVNGPRKSIIRILIARCDSIEKALVAGAAPPPPPPPPNPSLVFSAAPTTITLGSTAALAWTATNATSCTASNGWTGTKPVIGSAIVTPAATSTYALACTGSGGTASGSVTVTVSALPPPPPPPSAAPPLAWDAGVIVGTGDGFYGIAAHGTTLYAVTANGNTIFLQQSTNDGATWSAPALVGAGQMYLEAPLVIEPASGAMYLVYFDNFINVTDSCCTRALGNLYVRVSRDSGATWEPGAKLTSVQGAYRQSLVVVGNTVNDCWMDYRSAISWDVYCARSTDAGRTWSPERMLVQGRAGYGGPGRPLLAALGNTRIAVWIDDRDGRPPCYTYLHCPEVYMARSLDGGLTWEADRRVTFSPDGVAGSRPDIVAQDSTFILVYDRGGNSVVQQIYTTRSVDQGVSWSPPQMLSGGTAEASHATLFVGGPLLHVVWMQTTLVGGGDNKITHRYSRDHGVTWSPIFQVSINGNASAPLLTTIGSTVFPIWSNAGTYAVRRGRDTTGTAIVPDTAVTETRVVFERPSVVVGDSTLACAFLTTTKGTRTYGSPGVIVTATDTTSGVVKRQVTGVELATRCAALAAQTGFVFSAGASPIPTRWSIP